jgi:hypothetical protein
MTQPHRDKTRVQMAAKCFLIWNYYVGCLRALLLALTQSKETVFWSNLVFFTIKSRFWQYYSWLNMRKSHVNDERLVLLGPIISRFFACSNEEKNKLKQQRVRALVLSLCTGPRVIKPNFCMDVTDCFDPSVYIACKLQTTLAIGSIAALYHQQLKPRYSLRSVDIKWSNQG